MYVRICLCVCTYIWVSVRTYVCLYVCMHVCIFPRKLLKSLNTGQSQSKALLVGDWQSCLLLNTRWPGVRLHVIPQKPFAFSFEPAPHWTWSSLILLDCHLCLPPKHWDNDPPLTQLLYGSWGSHSGSVLLTEPSTQPELCFPMGRKWSSVRELRGELFIQGYIKKVGAQRRWDTACTPYFTDTAVTPQWRQQEHLWIVLASSRELSRPETWTHTHTHKFRSACEWEHVFIFLNLST